MRTQNPAATHCVLVTTVCWYAISVTAAPTHPIRRPIRFRFMPLLRWLPAAALGLLARSDAVAWMRDKGWELGGRGIKGREVNGSGADEEATRSAYGWFLRPGASFLARLGKRRFVMPFCQQPLRDHRAVLC
jgi:hypothetical protein